jgi:hypothetical protein
MKPSYQCNQCGQAAPSILCVFLHIFTAHMHADIELEPAASKKLIDQTFIYDQGYWDLKQIVFNSPIWAGRN